MTDVEGRLTRIEERNRRVEADKEWETSAIRRFTITMLTYVVLGSYLAFTGAARPWLGAVVPAVGYLLSTLALRAVRMAWSRTRRSAEGLPGTGLGA